MKKLRSKCLLIFIVVVSLLATGCPKRTTLDRVGAIVNASIDAYINQLEQLEAQGLLKAAKYQTLEQQAEAIKREAGEFNRLIAGFEKIRQGDAPAILRQASLIIGQINNSLADPALTALESSSGALKTLRYIRGTVDAASIAVAAIFPPPASSPDPTATSAPRGITIRPAVAPKDIVVNLPGGK